MSFSETCVRPRLLFGRFLQAYCKREKNYHKSTIDLNDCLKNSNGAFNSAKGKCPAFDLPLNYDSNAHLEGNNIVAELPSKQQQRHHAIYDLDVCLCNENGELKWHVHDGLFDRDGAITRAIEAIPIVGFFMALIHKQNGNPDHAKRALTLSGKGTFTILFGVIALQIAPFDPSAALVVAVMSFLGTIIADLTIETTGRSWIKNKRIAADIPDRSWTNTLLDGLVAGIAVGAGAGIAPHAEDAAARVVRTVATVPEEMALAEIELLSMESMVYNAPKLVKEIAKAATGGVVRATPGGLQMLATQDLKSGYTSPSSLQSSHVTPGRYYIANAQTGDFLELGLSGDGNGSQIQGAKASFKDNQVWIIEQGSEGQTLRSLNSDAYIGYPTAGTGLSAAQPMERDSAIEFRFGGNNKDGFSLCTLDKQSTGTVLSVNHDSSLEVDNKNVRFSDDVGALNQKWLLEECTASDVLELYQGPIPTNQVLHVRDVASNAPLELESAWKRGGLNRIFGRKTHGWTLESGFNGYYLKHCASGLYAFAAPNLQDNDMLPLTLGPAETEFIPDGNDQDGYSIIYASDPTYGLEIDRGTPVSGSNVFVLWRLNGSHSKWRIEN